jgi:iron complex outermembrane receptor protein
MKLQRLFFVTSSVVAAGLAQAETVTTAPVVVTATRFAASIDTAPVNVSVISAEDIANSSATTLAEVLKLQPGVNVSQLFGVTGSRSKVDLGGFGENGASNTLILLNGRRLNDLDLQAANLATIPLESIARVEIVQGSASVLYGDNAVGGAINIVTKSAFDGERAAVTLHSGSFQTRGVRADLRKLADDTALSLSVDRLTSAGYRDDGQSENASLLAEISTESNTWQQGVRYRQSWEDVTLPGSLGEPAYKADPKQSNFPYQATERRYSLQGFIDGEQLAAEVGLRNKHQETSYGSIAELETVSATPRIRRHYGNHKLIAGVDVYRSTLDAQSAYSTQYVVQKSDAVYASDAIALGAATELNLGLRRQVVEVKAANVSSGNDSRLDGLSVWDVSLSHRYRQGATTYLRIAKSFRSPVLDEMWNYTSGELTLIKPQSGHHYEVGTRQTFANGMHLEANLFRINLRDEIAYDIAAGPYGDNVNLARTRHDGLNLALRVPLDARLRLRAGYTWRKAEFRAGPNAGKDIPLVPRNKATLSGRYSVDGNGQLGLDAVYTGSRYFGNDDANAGKKMTTYTRLDMNYSRQFGHLRGRLLVNNVTNVKTADAGFYRSYAPYYFYYPLPERSFHLELEGSF